MTSRISAATPIKSVVTYKSTVSTDSEGHLDLKAEINYDASRINAPIAVVMHGYSGSTDLFDAVRANAQRLRDAGFFVVSVAMRGREGSDGTRDSGGIEIYDIVDAVEHIKAQFPARVNAGNVSITGYSGGGANVMSALTKFPDYFRAGSSFFGMSDYGLDSINGWYVKGAGARTSQLNVDIGNPTTNNPAVLDRYRARASNLASKNNPYSEIHLFVNQDEAICPPINSISYRDNAVAAATSTNEFDNITVHIGGPNQYQDFNNNQFNEPNEAQTWPHSSPTANQQHAAESWYLQRLLDGLIPQPTLNLQDNLYVAGFVKTQRFGLWLGDGQNGAAGLRYDLNGSDWSFTLDVLSSDLSLKGKLDIDTSLFAGHSILVKHNGELIETIQGGGIYKYANLGHGDILTLTSAPEPSLCAIVSSGVAAWPLLRRHQRKCQQDY
jgi:dienelactone hydrolase